MRPLIFLPLSALAGLTTCLSLPLATSSPHTPASTNLTTLNTTQQHPLQYWPPVPLDQSITPSISLNITGYGRDVCDENPDCEKNIADDMREIGWKVIFDYAPGAHHAYSFSSGDTNFVVKQAQATDTAVMLKVVHTLEDLQKEYGTVEIVKAGILIDSEAVAEFMLTFPGL